MCMCESLLKKSNNRRKIINLSIIQPKSSARTGNTQQMNNIYLQNIYEVLKYIISSNFSEGVCGVYRVCVYNMFEL